MKKLIAVLLSSGIVCCGARDGSVQASSPRSADPAVELLLSGRYPVREAPLDAGVRPVEFPTRDRVVAVRAPGDLTEPDTEYRLANDIVADGTAFTIKASRVTLNLNGHRIVYLNKPSPARTMGIAIPGYHRSDIAIVNGRIVQGEGGAAPSDACHPINDHDASDLEIAGLEIEYRTPETSGIELEWVSNARIHHNTVRDLGRTVRNRHQGVAAIMANRSGRSVNHSVHHNLIEGARHCGIRAGAGSEVSYNEVRIRSVVTNSTGIAAGGAIHQNRVLGQGVHPIGIWPGNDVKVFANYVEVQNTERGEEYGDTGASCLRMTWGNDNVEVMGNTFILHAEENYQGTGVKSWGRALWVGLPEADQNALFHDNLIVAVNRDGKAKAAAVAVVCMNESPGLVFRDNAIVSNWTNILLSDNYGHASGYARFTGNRIIRQGDYGTYRAIRSQYAEGPSTATLIDNSFENGASLDDIDLEFGASVVKELAIGWHLTVVVADSAGKPLSGAAVSVADRNGETVFEGVTDEAGSVSADVVAKLLTNRNGAVQKPAATDQPPGKGRVVVKTPHRIVVVMGESRLETTVTVDASRRVEISIKGQHPISPEP